MRAQPVIIIIAILALILSFIALWRAIQIEQTITNADCLIQLESCRDSCGYVRDTALIRIEIAETLTLRQFDLVPDTCGRLPLFQQEECRRRRAEARQAIIDDFADARKEVRINYNNCRLACARSAETCQRRSDPPQPSGGGIVIEIPGDCRGEDRTDESCRKRVDPICTKIGVCDDCPRSLCPGSEWNFESSSALNVDLIAVTSDNSKVRTVLTATKTNGKSTLSIPGSLKLNADENLYFFFTTEGSEKEKISIKITHQ